MKPGFPNILERGTAAALAYDAQNQEIICCAKGSKPPSLHTIFCYNQLACYMIEHKLLKVRKEMDKIGGILK